MQLPKELLELIVEEVIKVHIRQDEAKAKERKDWRLRNTELLLKNYRMLRSHCDGATEELNQYDNVFEPHELEIHSLMQYKAKTARMLDFVDTQLKAYRSLCQASGEASDRRFKVVDRQYIDPAHIGKSKKEIAEGLNIDQRTLYRDEKKAFEEISMYLFGFDSIQDLNVK